MKLLLSLLAITANSRVHSLPEFKLTVSHTTHLSYRIQMNDMSFVINLEDIFPSKKNIKTTKKRCNPSSTNLFKRGPCFSSHLMSWTFIPDLRIQLELLCWVCWLGAVQLSPWNLWHLGTPANPSVTFKKKCSLVGCDFFSLALRKHQQSMQIEVVWWPNFTKLVENSCF